MKTNYLFLSLAIVAMLFASCEADDTAEIVINNTDNSVDNSVVNNNPNNSGEDDETGKDVTLAGTYTDNVVLRPQDNNMLTGAMIMAPGTKLTIPAGTTIVADASGASVYIAISQGATIDAQGEANAPIVMTSGASAPAAGDWGGLIVLGRAPINSTSGGATSTSEIGGLPYGGNDDADFSGIITYTRVEYGGGAADGQSENNGFSFYGVGSGTTVNHIQTYIGADDGVEFFGGTVNVAYLSVVGAQDDSIDWTEGWSGSVNYAYVKHMESHDKAVEADGFNTDIGNNSNPTYFSMPEISNATFIGFNAADDSSEAVRLRAGTRGIFTNIYIQDFYEGFDLDGDSGDSPTGQGVVDGDLNVTGVNFVNVTTKLKNDTGVTFDEGDFILSEGDYDGTAAYATWGAGWTK